MSDYDAADRDFIEKMMENTSREIAVKKFLQPDPFLRGPAAALPVVRPARWTHAKLRFVNGGDTASPRKRRTGADAARTPPGWGTRDEGFLPVVEPAVPGRGEGLKGAIRLLQE